MYKNNHKFTLISETTYPKEKVYLKKENKKTFYFLFLAWTNFCGFCYLGNFSNRRIIMISYIAYDRAHEENIFCRNIRFLEI